MNRRQMLISVAASALLARVEFARASAVGEGVRPPVTKIRPKRIEQLGRVRIDNYAWLRDPNWAEVSLDPAKMAADIKAHLADENRYAEAILAPTKPRQDAYVARLAELASGSVEPPPDIDGDWAYYAYVPPGRSGIVHARRPAKGGAEQVLLDEGERARDFAYFRTLMAQHSPDHNLFVWAEDIEGGDRYRIGVHDLTTGKQLISEDANVFGWEGVVVSPDSRFIFWIWRDPLGRPTRIMRRPARGGPDVEVYAEKDPALFLSLGRTASGGFVTIRVSGPDVDEWHLIPGGDPTAAPILVEPRQPGTHYQVQHWADRLVILTDIDGALDGKLMTAPVATPGRANWQEWIAHKPGCQIMELHAFANHLVRVQRQDGKLQVVITGTDGASHDLAFDDAAYFVQIPPVQPYEAPSLRLIYETPAQPQRWIDCDFATLHQTVIREQKAGGFDPSRYRVERLEAPAPDGETVPVTVLLRADTRLDGLAPLLLHGYGAYGISSEASFFAPAIALVDQGWVFAIAHVRGGSEKGRRWFLDGRKFKKKNSFTDFNAAAEHLIAKSYTARARIVAYGLSAGGLLVGAALNLQPGLYAGVVAQVPFVDMLNTMSDADHPLVPAFRPDWGDPIADPEAYDYIASISPYENVHKAAYPMVLATAGVRDNRVSYWEPGKWIANLRAHTTSTAPILFRVEMAAGHQVSGGGDAVARQMALFWAFADLALEDADSRVTR